MRPGAPSLPSQSQSPRLQPSSELAVAFSAIASKRQRAQPCQRQGTRPVVKLKRSEEHTSELQSRLHLVCRLLLEKKKQYFNLYRYYLRTRVVCHIRSEDSFSWNA